jgi:hypothetical protein
MIKNYALVLAFFMLVTNLFGQQIDLATATTVAHNCFHAAAEIHNEYSKQNTTLTLTETITARVHEEHTNLYFIFTAEGEEGFVIVSADQRARPIIAYSLKNTFVQEEEHQPEAFRKWMQHYRQEIKIAIYENATIGEVLQSEWEMYLNAEVPKDGNKVDPLTTTTWDQPFPYNAYCPQDPNTGQRAVLHKEVVFTHTTIPHLALYLPTLVLLTTTGIACPTLFLALMRKSLSSVSTVE